MKKLIIMIVMLFSMTIQAQDTLTYVSTFTKVKSTDNSIDLYVEESVRFVLTSYTLTVDSLTLDLTMVHCISNANGNVTYVYSTPSRNWYHVYLFNDEIIRIVYENKTNQVLYCKRINKT